MENMLNSTIWESASRPLFVRSVWLDTTKYTRAPQRHFILDYEAQQKLQKRHKRQFSTSSYKGYASFQQSSTYDVSEIEPCRASATSPEYIDDLLTVASSKLQLQPPCMSTQTTKFKPKRTGPRRLTKRNLEKLDANSGSSNRSRHSANSLQHNFEQPVANKRLAERVLNWLDLAIKSVCTEVADFDLELECNASPSAQRSATVKFSETKPCSYGRWKKEEKTRQQAVCSSDTQQSQAEAVKCVSIVFDEEPNFKPVSAITSRTRKFSSCERTSKSADMRRAVRPLLALQLENIGKSVTEAPIETTRRSCSATRKCSPRQFMQDTRKQLHIFMPSLPEKNAAIDLNGPSLIVDFASTIDTASALSSNINE